MDIFQSHYIDGQGWSAPLPDYNSVQTLVLVFGHSSFLKKSEPFQEIIKKYPDSIIAGCSTPAVILGESVHKHGLVISVTRFWSTSLRLSTQKMQPGEEAETLGRSLAKQVHEDSLSAVLTFADGIHINGSQYIQGISHILGHHRVIAGGLSAYCGEHPESWVLKNGKPETNVASIIGLYGDSIALLSTKGSGWKAFGVRREVTKARQEVLYELDGKPALQLYKKYLGEAANNLPRSGLLYPLSIWSGNPEDNIVRSIIGINEKTQSISFAGDIPTGSCAQLMYGTLENLIEGAEEAVDSLGGIYTHSPGVLSIVSSCIGRLLVLDEDVEMEVDAVLRKLPDGTQQVGFYSAGEFATLNKGACALHNETLALTVIYEK